MAKPASKEGWMTNDGMYGWRDGGRGNPVSQLIAMDTRSGGHCTLDRGTCTFSIIAKRVCVFFWMGGGLEIHYPLSFGALADYCG